MNDAATWLNRLDQNGRWLAGTLLMPSIEVILLGVVVWSVLRIWRGPSPRIRYLLWLIVIIKPVVALVLPWQGPISFPIPLALDQRLAIVLPSGPTVETVETARQAYESDGWSAVLRRPYALVAAIWCTGVSVGLLWTLVGWIILIRRCRQIERITIPWVQTLFARCLKTVGIEHRVQLMMSHRFASPTLVTVGQPVVVIPSWCLERLSPQELKQVFLHELLHYVRRDHMAILVVQVVRILFFFHPIIWYAGRRLRAEAELACDVAVVTVARKPYSYVASLLKVAEGPSLARWRGVLELARPASLMATRIREVLNGIDDRKRVVSLWTSFLLTGLVVVVLPPLFHLPLSSPVSGPLAGGLQGGNGNRHVLPHSRRVSALPFAPARSVERTWTAATTVNHVRPHETDSAPVTTVEVPQMKTSPVRSSTIPGTTSPWLLKPSSLQTPPDRSNLNRWFHPAALGTPLHSIEEVPRTDAARWQSGQIELQGGGHTLSRIGLSGMMSVRAGYLVTKAHELGGVLSIVGPAEQRDEAESNKELAPLVESVPMRAARSRPLAAITPHSDDAKSPTVSNTFIIGGFYRYNIAGISEQVVPFVGMGTGVEMRPGRKPVLVDGSGGIRCFFADHAAMIVQVDYYKDVALSTRSRVSASLGVSTIF